jgi:hypothetical protein
MSKVLLNTNRLHAFSIYSALLAIVGCGDSTSAKRNLVWDVSAGTPIEIVNGGSWVGKPPQPGESESGYVYHVKGDRNLSMSIILPDKRRLDVDGVCDAYATKQGVQFRTIDLVRCEYSENETIDTLDALYRQWNGQGIPNIDAWRRGIHDRSEHGSHAVIHKPSGSDDLSITAQIRSLGESDEWYIAVTFFWKNTPL